MVSKTIKRNPLQLTTLQLRYERDLLKKFRKFKNDALIALKGSRALGDFRFLQPNFDLAYFEEQMERFILVDILQPARATIEDYDTQAYRTGSAFAETRLKNIGIAIALGVDTPIDQNVIKNLISKDISNLKNITQNMSTQIMRELAQGNQAGESYNKMAARLIDRYDAIGVTRAKTLVRTETQYAANEAAKTRYEQAGVKYAEWLTAADERVSDQDQNKEGVVFVLGDGITNGALPGQGYSPRDFATIPPSHPNCFLPGTRYKPSGDIIAGIWGNYSGKIIIIETVNGNRISVTPNHLFLTPHGFCAADLLDTGDNIICCTGFERVLPAINPNNDRIIPTVDEIIKSLSVSGEMLTSCMPSSPEYLHNDGGSIDGNINIIYPNGFLRNGCVVSVFDEIREHFFGTTIMKSFSFFSDRSLDLFVNAMFSTFNGFMSSRRETCPFFSGRVRHTDKHGLTSVSRNEPCTFHPTGDSYSCDPSIFGKLLNGFPGLVALDQIKDIKVDSFHGIVYDFQTTNTLSTAEGFITSNCRCAVVALTEQMVRDRGLIK